MRLLVRLDFGSVTEVTVQSIAYGVTTEDRLWSCKGSYGLTEVLRRTTSLGRSSIIEIDDFNRSSVITVGSTVTNGVPNVFRKVEKPF